MPAFQHISVGMQVFFLQAFFYSAFYNIINFTMTHSVILRDGCTNYRRRLQRSSSTDIVKSSVRGNVAAFYLGIYKSVS